MEAKCLYCYQHLNDGDTDYHPQCIRAFFGSSAAPVLDYRLDQIDQLAKEAIQQSITVPGVQPKLSLGLIQSIINKAHSGRLTIMDALDGSYILKPPNAQYQQMPENEHLSMKLAAIFNIEVVPSSLIRLASGELCYITKRIDRSKEGERIHMIDFLQILELDNKYIGTMEQLGKAIGELSANTMLDKLRFFELTLFNFIIGNNDMHLKNFSMWKSETFGWVLSPAYDLLNVQLVLPKDREETALLLGGKKKNLTRAYFDQFGAVLLLSSRQVNAIYRRFEKRLPQAMQLIEGSFLHEDLKQQYKRLVNQRMNLLNLAT